MGNAESNFNSSFLTENTSHDPFDGDHEGPEQTNNSKKANAEFKNVGYSRFRPHLLIMMVEEYLRTDDKEAKQRALTLIYKCYELLDSSWKDIHIKCHELMYQCATDLSDHEKTMIALINLLGEESIPKETKLKYFDHFQSLKNSIQLIVSDIGLS